MIKWIHHLLNPHCPECRQEVEDSKVCSSCEVLKQTNDHLRMDNEKLLRRILEKPEIIPERIIAPENIAPRPGFIPWNVRRQMLETEDRRKAQLMRQAPQPQIPIPHGAIKDTDELEKELGVAESKRESQDSAKS